MKRPLWRNIVALIIDITLWVVSFGDGTNSETKNRLQGCATGNTYYFHAADSAQLQQTFKQIADDISQLRLTR